MRKKALFSALSEKFRQNQVVVVDSLQIAEAKTKELAQILGNLPSGRKNTLLLLPDMRKDVIRASRNIPYLRTVQAREVSVLDVAAATFLVLPKESLQVLEKTFVH
ncbi:MAG: 50S ribosomal protein L4 [Candidatus Wildermuthbacteria bacterium RIFCSPHIGHO2_02_FULL_49_9]|nr:MAG: 50S ribosomal protein L4 [Candidatus Wildermuthbacteria bacterium RIFCSPHIGHO2_02_FULL_49_9]